MLTTVSVWERFDELSHVLVTDDLFVGVLRPQPPEDDSVHTVPTTRCTRADHRTDAQTGCEWSK